MTKKVKSFSEFNVVTLEREINSFVEREFVDLLSVQYQMFIDYRETERYTAVVLYKCP